MLDPMRCGLMRGCTNNWGYPVRWKCDRLADIDVKPAAVGVKDASKLLDLELELRDRLALRDHGPM